MKIENPDILVYTIDLGNHSTAVLVVNRKNGHTSSFVIPRIFTDKSILFKDPKIKPELVFTAIEQKGFYFNNKYVYIESRVASNPIIYNGMQIFLI